MIARYIVTTHDVRAGGVDGTGKGRTDTRMKSRIKRAGVLAAEAIGLVVAATALFGAFIFWRVQSGPVDLDWTAPAARAAANAAVFDGAVRRIDHLTLARSAGEGGYRLTLADVELGRRRAEASVLMPKVELEFYPQDFFSGKAGPRRMLIDGAALRVVRRADRKLKLDFGEPTAARAKVFQSLTGGAYFREAFERAVLRNATINFVDESSGRTWIGRKGEAEVVRTPGGYAASLASDFDIGGKASSLTFSSNYDLSTDVISSRLSLTDAPVGDLIAVFFNADAELLTSPVSGDATIDLSSDGTVLSSQIDLHAGEGMLTLGGWSTSISKFAASAAFDPGRNEFTVERLEWRGGVGEGAVAGNIALDPGPSGRGVERVNFALVGAGLTLIQPGFYDGPLAIGDAAATGSYGVRTKTLDLAEFSAGVLGVRLGGRLSVGGKSAKSPPVSAAATIDGALDPPTLLRIWPKGLAHGARDFVATRMPRARFSGVDFRMDLKADAIGPEGALPDEAMTLSFRAEDAEVIYAPGMTPLKGVAGAGVLKGNSFRFDANRGAVGAVRIVKGEVDIPVIAPKGEPAYFRFSATGDAGDMLSVLAEEPLAVLAETNFAPEQFSGEAAVAAVIERPNLSVAPRESYRYSGVATFDNLAVDSIIGDASLTSGKGRLDLKTEGMTIRADARMGEAPVSIDWRQRFYGVGDKTLLTVAGTADSSIADLFGVPTRQMAQGNVPFTAKAVGGVDAFRTLELEADFTETALIAETLGWIKPQGKPASGAAKFEFAEGAATISELSLEGEGVSVKGSASFAADGALKRLDIPTFRLQGAADLALTAERGADGTLAMRATGDYLNAAEIVRNLIDTGARGSGSKAPFALDATIRTIDFRGGASFRDASLDFARSADRIDVLNFTAVDADENALSIRLTPSGESAEQAIEARSADVGEMLAGLFGVSSVRGGEGRLDFIFTPSAEGASRQGTLEAHNLRVVKAPLLAKIFAAGSLTGLVDLMNGEGIELQNAMANFSIEGGAVRVFEARATGPSVGITAAGRLPLDGGAVELSGAVAPAYQVNSFLGKTPVIGDLFVSRKGEGLLALSYDVAGPANEPRVTVNPLSALAPGVFRRMFEGGRAEEEEPAPAEDVN